MYIKSQNKLMKGETKKLHAKWGKSFLELWASEPLSTSSPTVHSTQLNAYHLPLSPSTHFQIEVVNLFLSQNPEQCVLELSRFHCTFRYTAWKLELKTNEHFQSIHNSSSAHLQVPTG